MVEDAAQQAPPVERPWTSLRANPKVVLYAILANIGPLMFGYDLVIVGAISALPKFREDFGEGSGAAAILPALWLGLWNGLVQAGAAGGSVTAGWFQDRFGRRATFLLGGILGMIGTAAAFTSGMPAGASERRGLFLFAKIVIGAGCGVLMSACQTYISEIAPRNLRGVLLGFYAFNVSLGHLMAIAIVFNQVSSVSADSYRIPFGTQWAFGGMAVIAAALIPESPVWLVSRDHIEKAEKSVQRLGTAGGSSMLQRIQATLAHEDDDRTLGPPTYRECFQGVNLRRTRIIVFLNLLQQFVGMALLTNGAYFLIMAGMSARYSLMVNLIGVVSNMVANAISWYTVPRFGRRRMILISIVLDFGAWAGMGVAGCFSTPGANWFVGVALLLFGFFNSFGVASAVPVISSEISCVRLRSKSAGIGLAAQSIGAWIFSFFTPYMYNTDQANWGGKIGFFFAGLSVVAFVVTWLDVPETKGRTHAELDFLFEARTKSRAFAHTAVPEVRDAEDLKGGGEKF
ncbi:MFS transporter fmqE [Colletotrichum orbiculare MAFF 240422]|uniref:MFS transporter fmqE n=1 Tax=Colletotrichum orbiculare (strain 104-T / ATCC 96160 / CBS 514.97 / LARS 414 / MAFF 240422) TaxID=1213857 RepID=A0A484FNT6_COLOR|nr:MFS transporter fmqE [Colletotrichum orbiculare MAFF 240422]